MKKVMLAAAAIVASSLVIYGQQQPAAEAAPASESPVAPQPVPKSQEEAQALQALLQAPDPASRMQAADEFVVKFADSDFKGFAMMLAAEMARQTNAHDKAIIYAERALEADPKSYMAMIILASELAGTTRQHDLDREDKLKRAEEYATKAIEILKDSPRPQPNITDEQWAAAKADFTAQAHAAIGTARMVRKDCDGGIPELEAGTSTPNADPRDKLRLGIAYTDCGKPDQAIALFDTLLANTQLPPVFKQFAEREKNRALQKKGAPAQ